MVSTREVIGLAVSVLDAVDPFALADSIDLPASFDLPGPRTVESQPGAPAAPRALDVLERDQIPAEVRPLMAALERHLEFVRALRSAPTPTDSCDSPLTGREAEALLLLSRGLTAAAAARRMGCSLSTANKHFGNVYRKLGVSDRLGAVLEAQRRGLLSGGGPSRDSGSDLRAAWGPVPEASRARSA